MGDRINITGELEMKHSHMHIVLEGILTIRDLQEMDCNKHRQSAGQRQKPPQGGRRAEH